MKKMMEREDDDDSWRRRQIIQLFLCGLQEFSRASDGGPATGTSPKLQKRGDIFSPFFFSFWNLSTEVKESFDLYPEKLD
jgi:hypothetical protein